MSEVLSFRKSEERDLSFVYDSWLASWRNSHAAGPIPMELYSRIYRDVITHIMRRPGAELWVAYHPQEKSPCADLYGWACVEHGGDLPVVHYTFIKQAYRNLGIARRLLFAAGIDIARAFAFTFKTSSIARDQIPAAQWDPMLARYPRGSTGEKEHVSREEGAAKRRARTERPAAVAVTYTRQGRPL